MQHLFCQWINTSHNFELVVTTKTLQAWISFKEPAVHWTAAFQYSD